jgi:TonB-linked SusC/RagA family outer membrane protein
MYLRIRYAAVLLAAAVASSAAHDAHAQAQFAVSSSSSPASSSSATSARLVTFEIQDATLDEGLTEIGRQAGVRIMYGEDVLGSDHRATLRVRSAALAEALRAALDGTELVAHVMFGGDVVLVERPSEERTDEVRQGTITGRITSAETGAGLSGVQVLVEGTGQGTLTDPDGRYTIQGVAPGTYTVRVSLIGYGEAEQTVTVADGQTATANFQLTSQAVELEGIVAVGYSTKTEEQLPSAVVEVSAEELEGVTTEDVSTMLQGKAAGVHITSGSGEPGSGAEVRIRGTGSISASAEPLYVVDGVIADASMAQFIPASNIASVTVLKDAAATALYGSRAANGVIVITTKTGQPGETQVVFNSAVGVSDPVFGSFDLMNSRQLYEMQQAMGVPGLTQDLLSRDTNWRDLAFRRGLTTDLNMSASGGDEKSTFFVSGGYYNEEGTLISTGYDRISGRVNLGHDVNDRFQITARAYGNYETRLSNPAGALYGAYTYLPWDLAHNEDGTPTTGREAGWRGRDRSNFLDPLQYNWANGRSQDFGGDLKLEYDLAPWLSFSTTNRAEFEYDRYESYSDLRTSAGSKNGGELNNSNIYSNSILTSNLLRAERDYGAHSLGGLVGFEYQRNYYDGLSGRGAGIFPGLGIMDVTAEPLAVRGGKSESAFVSGFLQADYGFDDTYFATVSYRRDGSSRFGVDNRYGDFYSVGGAWLLSNERFMEEASAVDLLKLRASYGTTGNAEIGSYLAQSLYSYSAQYDGLPGSLPARLANPNLTWEVARTFNVGADVGLFDRVSLSIDAYRRINTDLLQNVELPKTSGFSYRTLNVGSVRNQGVEVALSTVNLDGALTWTTDLNVGVNRNEVLSLHGGNPILNGRQRIIEGRDIHTWYMREWAGVDPATGDPLWEQLLYDEEGNVTGVELTSNYNAATLQPVGTATPDFTGGVRNTLEYAGLSLSAFVNFVYGNELYHSARELFDSDGAYYAYNSMVLQDGWSRWEEPGDNATHPKAIPGGNSNSQKPSSRFLEDGSYLRLRNVTLSYDLPGSLQERLRIGSARVYLSGDNLLTLTNFSGMDPEAELFGAVGTKYPISKKLLLGIQMGW